MMRIILLAWCVIGIFWNPVTAQTAAPNPESLKTLSTKTEIGLPKPTIKAPESSKDVVAGIQIRGNSRVASSLIQNEILIVKGEEFNPYKVNRSIKNIQAMGVFESVRSSVTNVSAGKRVTFTVKENPLIKRITFQGNKTYSDQALGEVIVSRTGDLLNLGNVRDDITKIESHYKDNGYFLIKVYRVITPDTNGSELKYVIGEGILDEIIITGNTRTRDNVIRRELKDIKLGEPLNDISLKRDLRKIFNLNYFGKLDPSFEPTDEPDHYKLKLSLEEKSTGSVNFGAGYGQRSGLFAYSDLNIDNIFGTGQLIMLKGQWGENANSYQFKYHNPWMWDDRKSFTFRLWDTQGNIGFDTIGGGLRREQRQGFSTTFGVPITYDFRTSHEFKWENIEIPENTTSLGNKYHIRSYNFGVSYDTRDVAFNPREGMYHYISIEKGLPVDDIALDFIKYDTTWNWFFPTFEKQTFATRFILGQMSGDTEPSELYYVGGPNTVRGYAHFPNSFANGEQRLITNFEYRFLINDIFQTLVFVDWGWSRSLGNPSKGKWGKGFGIRIMSPLGPIRLDFGLDELNEMRIHFNIGHVF
ncbi:MAG: BamA/TamA family outer membrane protein [bacterium]|nr:BamA/TamA family outer membrane protein [bacterium]